MTNDDKSLLLDWYASSFHEGYLASSDGGCLRYAINSGQSGKGTIVIVSGRTEFIEKYLEVAHDLEELNLSICLYDHRGQGKSGRQFEDPDKGHLEDFNDYVADLVCLIETVVLADQTGPVYLLTHSLGGAVGIRLTQMYTDMINGMILVSPMLQINTGLLPPLISEMICMLVCAVGGKSLYVWGTTSFNPDMDITNNSLTTDLKRLNHNIELVKRERELGLGGPTFGWMLESYRAMRKARQQAHLIKCPIIAFRSIHDRVVGLEEIERFCNTVQGCELVNYYNCQHELLMEQDEIRDGVIERIKTFLRDKNGSKPNML